MQTMKHRWSLLSVIASLVAIVALTYLAFPPSVAEAGKGGRKGLTLNIHFHGDTFDFHNDRGTVDFFEDPSNPHPGDGPFYVEGDIVDEAGEAIGEFNCWGWIRPGGPGFVSQEYNLFDRGAIQTQGNEGSDSIAVVGGTGDFSDARGEGFFGPPEFGTASFSVTFKGHGLKK